MRALAKAGWVRVIEGVAARLPSHTFSGVNGPYLTKFTVFDRGAGGVRVHLHRFHRSDEDPELHSHPWLCGASLILAGGYVEERRTGTHEVVRLERVPGSVSLLGSETFHRVDLRDPERVAWTLFITGPIASSWRFWDRATGKLTPWRAFIAAKGMTPLSSVEGRR